jgi:ATP-dependent exoDNAse (exonuclease V) beta subunit
MSEIKLSPEQELAVFFPQNLQISESGLKKNLVIEAGAGAGKTRVLTDRVRWLLFDAPKKYRLQPQELVLVTFSKAADEELRHRIEKEIGKTNLPAEQIKQILSRLHISTIDSLFMQIVNNLFPSWWEQTKNRLGEDLQKEWQLTEQRFPPAVTLVSEAELFPELAEEILQILDQNCQNPLTEITVLDFILSGAFSSQRHFGTKSTIQHRHRGLDRIVSAMLHENFISDNAPPLRLALERIHPSSVQILGLIQSRARELFRKRIMHGRLTHNDRALFLFEILSANRTGEEKSFFAQAESLNLPMSCSELIVDEYQDTNQLQHDILCTLIRQPEGRMVVVGDPKQSIYGFRSAHVGVFQKLKSSPQWKVIDLTRNYRSHPELLPFINLLSDMTFSYRNSRIPEAFQNTNFALMAEQTFVKAKALDAGRTAGSSDSETEQEPPYRLLLLGASLKKERAAGNAIPKNITANTFSTWALARELKTLNGQALTQTDSLAAGAAEESSSTNPKGKTYAWSKMAVLCETNDHAAQTQQELVAFGVPAVAKLSRAPEQQMERKKNSEELGLLLAKWLCKPIETGELASFLWSGWLDLTREETSLVFEAHSNGLIDPQFIQPQLKSGSDRPPRLLRAHPELPQLWTGWLQHLAHCRTLVPKNFFAAWQILRWGYVSPVHNLAMENSALVLHDALDVWSVRRQLEDGGIWPEEFLATQLRQIRQSQSQSDSAQDAVTVCTIHAAKGLEWPVVVFWPKSSPERPPEEFVMKSGESSTFIKWLAEDKESASLIPWIDNPTPPEDQVAIHLDSENGEKIVRWSADLQDKLEQEFERQRVFYTAFTRAQDVLIVMSPALARNAFSNMRDRLSTLKKGVAFDPLTSRLSALEFNVTALLADSVFELRKEAKPKAVPPEPWSSLQIDAECKISEWDGLVRMRDYSPAWLFAHPEILHLQPASSRDDHSQDRARQLEWIHPWLDAQHQKSTQTPWLASTCATPAASETTGRPAASEGEFPETSNAPTRKSGSSAETGQRFHALMEHTDPKGLTENKFLHDLLTSASVRLHELEMWSAAEVIQHHLYAQRDLLATQRRIIDLFCAINIRSLPKNFLNQPCLKLLPSQTGSAQELFEMSTLSVYLKTELDLHSHLHLVIDFKTGSPDPEHITQMRRYLGWTNDVLTTQPEQLLGGMTHETLFAGSVRPLVGIIYYSSLPSQRQLHNFSPSLARVDKNAAVLFIIPE